MPSTATDLGSTSSPLYRGDRGRARASCDLEAYLEPFAAPTGAAALERLVVSLDDGDIRAVRLGLATLEAPTLIVWGTGDVYFDRMTATELLERIGGARELVELDGAKLFFPDERPHELVPLLRRHWRSA